MKKLMSFIGVTIFSSIGWALGERVGIFTAVMLSIVGTGLGMYAGIKAADHYDIG